MKSTHKIIFSVGLMVLSLSACVSRKYNAPTLSTEGLYRDVNTTDTISMASMSWQSLFPDPDLQALIKEGLDRNLDLKQAIERIKIASATLAQSKSALFPSLQADISATDAKQSAKSLNFPPGININLNTQSYRAQLSTSWEADIWGKLSSAKRSAYASLLQTDATKRAIQTELIANIANAYYNLM
ncbi:MAG: TolC family protein, partial [Pedobacter sp.]|nr:TolC family protein [Pedobacter sp.]